MNKFINVKKNTIIIVLMCVLTCLSFGWLVGQLGFFGFRNMPRLGGLEQLALAQSLLWHRFSIHPFTLVFILHTGAYCLSKGIQGTRWGTS